jgi:hypothetical protein
MTQKNGITITSSHIWFVEARSIADANGRQQDPQRAAPERHRSGASSPAPSGLVGARRSQPRARREEADEDREGRHPERDSVRRPKNGSKRKG